MQAVILAAGESSRFWPLNTRHKSLIKMRGSALIWYTVRELEEAGAKEAIIVQGPEKEIEKELGNYKFGISIKYAVQPESKGMGDALLCAEKLLDEEFFVLNPYHAEILKSVFSRMSDKFKEIKKGVIFLGKKTDKPWLYGIFKLNKETEAVEGIVEKPKKGTEPSDIRIVGIYLLQKKFL